MNRIDDAVGSSRLHACARRKKKVRKETLAKPAYSVTVKQKPERVSSENDVHKSRPFETLAVVPLLNIRSWRRNENAK